MNNQEQMIKANLEQLTEGLEKPILKLANEFKTLSKRVEDIAEGLVKLSMQQDILKDWIDHIHTQVNKEQDENQSQNQKSKVQS